MFREVGIESACFSNAVRDRNFIFAMEVSEIGYFYVFFGKIAEIKNYRKGKGVRGSGPLDLVLLSSRILFVVFEKN